MQNVRFLVLGARSSAGLVVFSRFFGKAIGSLWPDAALVFLPGGLNGRGTSVIESPVPKSDQPSPEAHQGSTPLRLAVSTCGHDLCEPHSHLIELACIYDVTRMGCDPERCGLLQTLDPRVG